MARRQKKSKSLRTLDEETTLAATKTNTPRLSKSFLKEASHNSQTFIAIEDSTSLFLGPVFDISMPNDLSTTYLEKESDPLLLKHPNLERSR